MDFTGSLYWQMGRYMEVNWCEWGRYIKFDWCGWAGATDWCRWTELTSAIVEM